MTPTQTIPQYHAPTGATVSIPYPPHSHSLVHGAGCYPGHRGRHSNSRHIPEGECVTDLSWFTQAQTVRFIFLFENQIFFCCEKSSLRSNTISNPFKHFKAASLSLPAVTLERVFGTQFFLGYIHWIHCIRPQ